MASRRAEVIADAYGRRLAAIRAEVDRRLAALYRIDEDAIDESFQRFVERAVPIIAGGRASAATIAAAFIRSISLAEVRELPPVPLRIDPMTTSRGEPLPGAMAPIAGMILASIGRGRTAREAIEAGSFFARRLADNEVVAANDQQASVQAGQRIIGWEGIVEAGACDPCRDNAGEHDRDWELYRHASCGCSRIPIFAAG